MDLDAPHRADRRVLVLQPEAGDAEQHQLAAQPDSRTLPSSTAAAETKRRSACGGKYTRTVPSSSPGTCSRPTPTLRTPPPRASTRSAGACWATRSISSASAGAQRAVDAGHRRHAADHAASSSRPRSAHGRRPARRVRRCWSTRRHRRQRQRRVVGGARRHRRGAQRLRRWLGARRPPPAPWARRPARGRARRRGGQRAALGRACGPPPSPAAQLAELRASGSGIRMLMPTAAGSARCTMRSSRAMRLRGQGHWPMSARLFWSIATTVTGSVATCRGRSSLVGVEQRRPQPLEQRRPSTGPARPSTSSRRRRWPAAPSAGRADRRGRAGSTALVRPWQRAVEVLRALRQAQDEVLGSCAPRDQGLIAFVGAVRGAHLDVQPVVGGADAQRGAMARDLLEPPRFRQDRLDRRGRRTPARGASCTDGARRPSGRARRRPTLLEWPQSALTEKGVGQRVRIASKITRSASPQQLHEGLGVRRVVELVFGVGRIDQHLAGALDAIARRSRRRGSGQA